jgi:hypothetical protein
MMLLLFWRASFPQPTDGTAWRTAWGLALRSRREAVIMSQEDRALGMDVEEVAGRR